MKKTLISILVTASLFPLANGQIFELQDTSKKPNVSASSPTTGDDEDIIVDKSSEEVIIPAQAIPQVDKWMSIVQAKDRDYSLIEKTLQSGQNANQGIFDGSSMLHLAAWQNDEKLFRLGLQYGGSLSNTNKNGETVIHWAAYSRNPNIIALAFSSDKNAIKLINKQNRVGRTALHFNALQWGNLDIAKTLILNKADLNIKDSNGQTPLHYALALRKWDLAKLYIDSGADFTVKDKNGDSIDEYIMTKGDVEAFKIFYKYLNPENQAILKSRLGAFNFNP